MKIYQHDAGHMTKMAAMGINGKKPTKFVFHYQQTDFNKTFGI